MSDGRKFLIDEFSPTEVLQVKRMFELLVTMSRFEKETMENMEKLVEAIKDLRDNINTTKKQEEDIQGLKISYIEMKGDVAHIKNRLDNGISPTLAKISDKFDEFLPMVKDNSYWVGKFKWAVIWVAVVAVAGGLVTFLIKK